VSIRLALVDDQKLFTAALGALLDLENDLEVVGLFSNNAEACAGIIDLGPDLVISDIEMPDGTGFDLVRELSQHSLKMKFIMLSTFARANYVEQVLELGINGYLLKESPPESLISAIRSVVAGLTQIDSKLLQHEARPGAALTDREKVLLHFIREGKVNKDIAGILGLSPGTVRNIVSDIISKLGAQNRIEACRIAEELGWL